MNNIRNYTDSSSGFITSTAMGFYDDFLERLCEKIVKVIAIFQSHSSFIVRKAASP